VRTAYAIAAERTGRRSPARAFVIQLADDLEAEHGAERVALAVAPPPTTNDERFDALIAGLTELRLEAEGLPLPKWLSKTPASSRHPGSSMATRPGTIGSSQRRLHRFAGAASSSIRQSSSPSDARA
jgi:hypothetical protein